MDMLHKVITVQKLRVAESNLDRNAGSSAPPIQHLSVQPTTIQFPTMQILNENRWTNDLQGQWVTDNNMFPAVYSPPMVHIEQLQTIPFEWAPAPPSPAKKIKSPNVNNSRQQINPRPAPPAPHRERSPATVPKERATPPAPPPPPPPPVKEIVKIVEVSPD